MKKASVIGHFAVGHEYLDGQTVKTKIITNELCNSFGTDDVQRFDTHGGAKTLLKAPLFMLSALRKTKNVIIMPAHNGLRVFGRLLPFFRRFFKSRKIHYVVIGGWLSEFLKNKKGLSKALKKFDGIYVETSSMKKALEAQGFKNIFVMPNCKELTPISVDELVYQVEPPYKLCTFSRVSKEKGIGDAVEAVKSVNEKLGRTVYTLDIYGQVDSDQTEWFENLKKDFPEYVRYGGLVAFDKSVEVLKDYFALLFPTRFYTEGIPGTLIDACAAGVPVITALWMNYSDVFTEGVTGWGFEFGNFDQFKALLEKAAEDPKKFSDMKTTALAEMKKFQPHEAIQNLIQRIQ